MLSIIIPTLNELDTLAFTIKHTLAVVTDSKSIEIIVIDSGSTDGTLESIQFFHVKSYSTPEFIFKKNLSLNFGAERASYETFLFLDADTLLPKNFDKLIEKKLRNQEVVGGAFEFSFQNTNFKLWLLSLINRMRYRLGNVFYGDQAVWVRKEVFKQIDGFTDEQLMETAYLCKKLRKKGPLSIIQKPVKTSPRRFNTYGFFKIVWFDFKMFIRFSLGFSISNYAHSYWSKNLNQR